MAARKNADGVSLAQVEEELRAAEAYLKQNDATDSTADTSGTVYDDANLDRQSALLAGTGLTHEAACAQIRASSNGTLAPRFTL
jgi:hypothetical protein